MSLLEVKDLRVSFFSPAGEDRALDGVSFSLDRRQVLGLVGESGSGKSVTALSILRLLGDGGRIVSGSIRFDGQELSDAGERAMRQIRGGRIAAIFGDPADALDPARPIGRQIAEAVTLHKKGNRRQARERTLEVLRLAGIDQPERKVRQYPCTLSPGTRQRVLLALALACAPDLLIADEPAAALDVTEQAPILDLLKRLQEQLGFALLLLTRDPGTAARLCHRAAVLYAGSVCEQGTAEEVLCFPKHAYTRTLLWSVPSADRLGRRLKPAGVLSGVLSGEAPGVRSAGLSAGRDGSRSGGCAFAPLCPSAMRICLRERCGETRINGDHTAFCWMNRKPVLTPDAVGKPVGPSLEDGPGAGIMFPGTFTDGQGGQNRNGGRVPDTDGGRGQNTDKNRLNVPDRTDADGAVSASADTISADPAGDSANLAGKSADAAGEGGSGSD